MQRRCGFRTPLAIWLQAVVLFTIHYSYSMASDANSHSPYFQRPYMWSEEEGKWILRGRLGAAVTTASFPELKDAAEQQNFDGKFVSSSVILDGEIGYNFTDYVSVSASMGYIPQETVTVRYIPTNTLDEEGRVHIMPMALTVQLHPAPYGAIRPYVGAGLYYAPIVTSFDRIDLENAAGVVFRAGADWWVKEDWGVNIDLRYYNMTSDADVGKFGLANGEGSLELDPFIISAGLSYRFP
jgi:outer membrane protein